MFSPFCQFIFLCFTEINPAPLSSSSYAYDLTKFEIYYVRINPFESKFKPLGVSQSEILS